MHAPFAPEERESSTDTVILTGLGQSAGRANCVRRPRCKEAHARELVMPCSPTLLPAITQDLRKESPGLGIENVVSTETSTLLTPSDGKETDACSKGGSGGQRNLFALGGGWMLQVCSTEINAFLDSERHPTHRGCY